MKLQFLQRLREKGLVKLSYAGTLIQSYQVINQTDLYFVYYKDINKVFLEHNKISMGTTYRSYERISPGDFVEKLNSPQLKQEFLFNLNLFQ